MPVSYEIILVVNGGDKASFAICAGLAGKLEHVQTLYEERSGWGLAVRRGLAVAKGDLLSYTNCARTAPQDLLLMLLYALANPEVIVKANRRVRDSWPRRLGSLLYNLECRALFDLSYWDINGTPKVFPRRFEKLTQLRRDDDLIDLEFNVLCRREGYPVLEVPILSGRRHGGVSTTRMSSALKLYVGAYRMWREEHLEHRLP